MTQPRIPAVAWCPHPPLLLPLVGVGSPGEFSALRAACIESVRTLHSAPIDHVMVIGSTGPERGLAGFAPGVGQLPTSDLPLSLAVGDWLLDQAEIVAARSFVAVSADGSLVPPDRPAVERSSADATALLVMGDGTARRSVKGPGYLDARAEPFDGEIVRALATGDVAGLAGLDDGLAAELMVGGIGAWKAAAAMLTTECRWQSQVAYADAPLGVMYVVASWLAT